MYKIYGIPNCDTVKKAQTWLKEHDIPYEFHDYKKLGISAEKLAEWLTQYPQQTLINRSGTTWKKLSEEQKNSVVDAASAIPVMLTNTSAIKRPIIEKGNIIAIGFRVEEYEKILIKNIQ